MIFQASIKLNIKDRDVQVNFDFDTGLIGFTENLNGKLKEYYYSGSPNEFKIALFKKLEKLYVEDRHLNFKICRKNPDVIKVNQLLSEKK